MANKTVSVCFRFLPEVELFIEVATKYCQYMHGPDKRGSGYGNTVAESKALKKEIEAKFGSVEGCRQYLAKFKSLTVNGHDRWSDKPRYETFAVGTNAHSFEEAYKDALAHSKKRWKNPEEGFELIKLMCSLREAEALVKGHEETRYISYK